MEKVKTEKKVTKNTKVIKWTNNFSGDTGYVQMIRTSKGHFVNTEDREKARKYRSEKEAGRAIEELIKLGEGETNTFSVEDLI